MGHGPFNALHLCLRKCLAKLYPQIAEVHLKDYKVRVLDSYKGTAANVRVLIEWSDHQKSWSTVGVSDNVIEASWRALVDAIRLELMRLTDKGRRRGSGGGLTPRRVPVTARLRRRQKGSRSARNSSRLTTRAVPDFSRFAAYDVGVDAAKFAYFASASSGGGPFMNGASRRHSHHTSRPRTASGDNSEVLGW